MIRRASGSFSRIKGQGMRHGPGLPPSKLHYSPSHPSETLAKLRHRRARCGAVDAAHHRRAARREGGPRLVRRGDTKRTHGRCANDIRLPPPARPAISSSRPRRERSSIKRRDCQSGPSTASARREACTRRSFRAIRSMTAACAWTATCISADATTTLSGTVSPWCSATATGRVFTDFTKSLDVIGHELTHGVTENTAGLEYHNQPGALNESISDVFGSLVKQWSLKQSAAEADWLIGTEIFTPGTAADALRSMKAPGTAYSNALPGEDPQPDHMSKFAQLPDTEDGDWAAFTSIRAFPTRRSFLSRQISAGSRGRRRGTSGTSP